MYWGGGVAGGDGAAGRQPQPSLSAAAHFFGSEFLFLVGEEGRIGVYELNQAPQIPLLVQTPSQSTYKEYMLLKVHARNI